MKLLPLTTLATLSLLVACSNQSAPDATGAPASSDLAETTITTSTPTETTPENPASTTTQKTPTTEPPKTQTQTTSSSQGPAPELIASSTASSLQAAFDEGNFAAQYQAIWEKVKAAGGTIKVVGTDAADPKNPLRPQAAAKYALTIGQSSFCLTRSIDKASNSATFQTTIGQC
jgi:hypothetical protein